MNKVTVTAGHSYNYPETTVEFTESGTVLLYAKKANEPLISEADGWRLVGFTSNRVLTTAPKNVTVDELVTPANVAFTESSKILKLHPVLSNGSYTYVSGFTVYHVSSPKPLDYQPKHLAV
jgi:hypothetical protein